MLRVFSIALMVTVLFASCSSESADLKLVQQLVAGEYTVQLLSDSGTMKNGTGDFTLEFRKTSDNQLVDVGSVEVAPVMEMTGMAPMMGTATVTPTDTPGRYQATGTLTMAGLWKLNVRFGSGQSVRFSVNAE